MQGGYNQIRRQLEARRTANPFDEQELDESATYRTLRSLLTKHLFSAVAAFYSILSGWIVLNFLQSIGAPFPEIDASLVAMFVVLFLCLLFLIGVMTFTVFVPSLMLWRFSRSMRTALLRRNLLRATRNETASKEVRFLLNMMHVLVPCLFMAPVLFMAVLYYSMTFSSAFEVAVGVVLTLLVFACSTLALFCYVVFPDATPRRKKSDLKIWISLSALSAYMLLWSTSFYAIANSVLYFNEIEMNEDTLLLLVVVVLSFLLVFYFQNAPFVLMLPVIWLFWTLGLCVIYPAYTGGFMLRFIGAGGSIPISALVRTSVPTAPGGGLQVVRGCMIMSTASQLMLIPTEDVSICEPRKLYQSRIQKRVFSEVVVIAKSGVVAAGPFGRYDPKATGPREL